MINKIIIDTNIILSGLKSKNGYSYKLLKLIPDNIFQTAISVPLILEYESVLMNNIKLLELSKKDIENFINYICKISEHTKIYYLWRPFLKDPYDDHLLEVAVASSSHYIITFNIKDFKGTEKFGIKALNPKEFIKILGVKL
jgi:putative PIN family toxin of toxin-antitoxin system